MFYFLEWAEFLTLPWRYMVTCQILVKSDTEVVQLLMRLRSSLDKSRIENKDTKWLWKKDALVKNFIGLLNFYKTTNWCSFFSVAGWAWWSQTTISKRKTKNLKWEDFVQCCNCCLALPPVVDRCIKVLLLSSALLNSHLITRVHYSAFTLSPLGTLCLKAK